MSDYAGAVAAIRARLEANWTTTPIAFQNEAPPEPWPPVADDGSTRPWVFLEVIGTLSEVHAFGATGGKVWRYLGLIHVHVIVPLGVGAPLAQQYAVSIGEIFRGAKFYDNGDGDYVRSWSPQTDGGGSDADNGNFWRVTMTCDFEYFHRG